MRLWINDVLTVDYAELDEKIPRRGIIGLQIHANATEIRYKDLLIEELGASKEANGAKPAAATLKLPVVAGPFKPSWESLQQYRCPNWYRDAKFGIWARWGPQCEPEAGDWYARKMYDPSGNPRRRQRPGRSVQLMNRPRPSQQRKLLPR